MVVKYNLIINSTRKYDLIVTGLFLSKLKSKMQTDLASMMLIFELIILGIEWFLNKIFTHKI